ncbi:S8 family serine peptidase [Polaribacter sp.]|uniref:S8 family peptidase n=1 Tax=Polaribacter sp. TaxID=1920175 RepID=UPI003EF2CF41
MKVLKSIFFTATACLVFTSCATSLATIPVPKGVETVVNVTAKKGSLSEDEMNRWSHADLEKDSIPGMSIDKAYQFLEGKKGVEVVVAIADSGIDVEHEDLKDVVWTNPKEIVGNNIDDDQNGYVDDIHGWNFLGNKEGKIIHADQLEITRIVKKGMHKFGDKKASEISKSDKNEFQEYLELKEKFDKVANKKATELENLKKTKERIEQIEGNFVAVKNLIGDKTISIENLKNIKPTGIQSASQISDVINLLKNGITEEGLEDYKKGFLEYKSGIESEKGYDLDFNARQTLGDNMNDINDKFYGNNNVIGSKELEIHGTHVAGIVAASRNNNKGVNGVADHVKIMAVRVVPDGDEHDKDVALGIRYAVDNGAKIINTSFGKSYSPNKKWVHDAIKYAAKKDVLIVNAAGNSHKNIDIDISYPNDTAGLENEISDNFLTIGAINVNYDENLLASFTNYGKKNVDVFAPGVNIYATFPSDNYKAISGTSMASPGVAGVAALVRSYYPQLSASQVKHIIMNSGTKVNLEVLKPGSKDEKIPFGDLSVSGRIVNAYSALKMADSLVNQK